MRTKFTIACFIMMVAHWLNPTANSQTISTNWSLAGNSNATSSSKLGTTSNIPLRIVTNNAERIHVNGNTAGKVGYVGIGTNIPATRLHVNGIITASGGNSANWNLAYTRIGANTNNYIPRWNGNAFVSGIVYDNGSRLGIGTSTPTALVDIRPVNFAINQSGGIKLAATSGDWPSGIYLRSNTSGTPRLGLEINSLEAISVLNGGNIGIGISIPTAKLDIRPVILGINQNGGIKLATTTNAWASGMFLRSNQSGIPRLSFDINNNEALALASGGNVGIGFPTPSHQLTVNGDIAYTGNLVSLSDARFKTGITPAENVLEKIMKLKPSTYQYRQQEFSDLKFPTQTQYGLIAQELEQVFPEFVTDKFLVESKNNENYKAVNYIALIPVLIAGMQEQQKEIDRLKSELAAYSASSPSKKMDETVKEKSGKPSLKQNSPNPFSKETRIGYYLPDGSSGLLQVLNSSGQEVLSIPVSKTGTGEILISAGSLVPGTYTYLLTTGGETLDSRQMIITR